MSRRHLKLTPAWQESCAGSDTRARCVMLHHTLVIQARCGSWKGCVTFWFYVLEAWKSRMKEAHLGFSNRFLVRATESLSFNSITYYFGSDISSGAK